MNISFVYIFLNVWTSFEFINIFWLNKHLFNRRTFFKKIGEQIFIFIFVNGHFFQIPEYVLNTWSFFQNHEYDFISQPFFKKLWFFIILWTVLQKHQQFLNLQIFYGFLNIWICKILFWIHIFFYDFSNIFFENLQILDY